MQSTVDIIHTFVPKNSSKQLACCDKQTLIFDRAPWPLIVADTCGSVRLFAAKISSNMCYQVKAIYMHFVVQRSQLPVSLVYNSAIARSISFFCNKKPSSSSSSVANENKISPTAMVFVHSDYILLYHHMSVCQDLLDIRQVQCICMSTLIFCFTRGGIYSSILLHVHYHSYEAYGPEHNSLADTRLCYNLMVLVRYMVLRRIVEGFKRNNFHLQSLCCSHNNL